MTDALRDEETIAHDMIDVHGTEAAAVARANARAAALAGQVGQAKSWIRILGIIQRRQTSKATPSPGGRTTRILTDRPPTQRKDDDHVYLHRLQSRARFPEMVRGLPAGQRRR